MMPKFDSEFDKDKVFEIIQKEMVSWQAHNFPGRESWMPLMGLGEEIGELASSKKLEEIYDAIGDCCIYIADYCNAMGYDMQEIKKMSLYSDNGIRNLTCNYGKLCHAHLKMIQNIRMNELNVFHISSVVLHEKNSIEALSMIIDYLNMSSARKLETIVWEIWIKVRQRDWQSNPETAHLQRSSNTGGGE